MMPKVRANPVSAPDQAIMIVWMQDNPGLEGEPLRWRAGEITNIVPADWRFGWAEFPHIHYGDKTVAQVNAIGNPPVYATARMVDAGIITVGTESVEVSAGDDLGFMYGGYWRNFGPMEDTPHLRGHLIITDKTEAEVGAYLEAFNKKLTYTSDLHDPETDLRRWTTTNVRVSSSGNNGFSAAGIQNAIDSWNESYPGNTVALHDTDNLNYFQVQGIMPDHLYDEWRENTQAVALEDYYKRRRWYIIEQGRDALDANDRVITGAAAQVSQYLRDGLLD